ncbi:unnamed protein product, partial [Peniophora sp. CBMAI 1063]
MVSSGTALDTMLRELFDSGDLVSLLLEILLDPTFFKETPEYIAYSVYPLTIVASYGDLPVALAVLLRSATPLWTHVWDNRRHLTAFSTSQEGERALENWLRVIPDSLIYGCRF